MLDRAYKLRACGIQAVCAGPQRFASPLASLLRLAAHTRSRPCLLVAVRQ
jgi:hypothetical protein